MIPASNHVIISFLITYLVTGFSLCCCSIDLNFMHALQYARWDGRGFKSDSGASLKKDFIGILFLCPNSNNSTVIRITVFQMFQLDLLYDSMPRRFNQHSFFIYHVLPPDSIKGSFGASGVNTYMVEVADEVAIKCT